MICARARGPSCAWAWRAQRISRSPRVEDPRPYYQLQSVELSAFGHARSHTAVHRGFECPFFYLFFESWSVPECGLTLARPSVHTRFCPKSVIK